MVQSAVGNTKAQQRCWRRRSCLLKNKRSTCYYSHQLEAEMQALEKETSVEVEVNFSPLLRRYTLEEFWALPEREDHARYNLIGGCLFMVPPPNPPHGDVDSHMNTLLMEFLLRNKIEGKVHH